MCFEHSTGFLYKTEAQQYSPAYVMKGGSCCEPRTCNARKHCTVFTHCGEDQVSHLADWASYTHCDANAHITDQYLSIRFVPY